MNSEYVIFQSCTVFWDTTQTQYGTYNDAVVYYYTHNIPLKTKSIGTYILISYFFTFIRMLDENESDTYFLYGDILAGNKNVELQMKFFL